MHKTRILDICKAKNITQKDLAAKIGISRLGLAKAIKGNPTLATLEKIAAALGCEVSELLADNSEGVITCPHCGAAIKLTPALIGGAEQSGGAASEVAGGGENCG